MKSNTRGFVAFVATGCLAASAVGWGVWRATTPETALSAATDSTSIETTIGNIDDATSISEAPPTSTSEVTSSSQADAGDRGSSSAEVIQSDPFLAPNAYIPPAGAVVSTAPTRIFSPQSPEATETMKTGSGSEAETTLSPEPSRPAAPGAENPDPRDTAGDTTARPNSEASTSHPASPSPSENAKPTEGANGQPALGNNEVHDAEPSVTEVSPPTLAQPVPTVEEVSANAAAEPEPAPDSTTEPVPMDSAVSPTPPLSSSSGLMSAQRQDAAAPSLQATSPQGEVQ